MKKYRIVTNGERFRIQKLRRFLYIKWWGRPSERKLEGAFYRLWDAERSLEEHSEAKRFLKHQKVKDKEGRRGPWKPIEKEN